MTSPRLSSKLVAATVASSGLALGIWCVLVGRAIHPVKSSSVRTEDKGPRSFLRSKTCTTVINPKDHVVSGDARSIVVVLPEHKIAWSDEQILAAFVKGFFGGWGFFPESKLLRLAPFSLVEFSKAPHPKDADCVWSSKSLADTFLPPVGTILFGAFQLVDKHIEGTGDDLQDSQTEASYVDFAFGSDRSSFAGAHRFSLRREKGPSDMASSLAKTSVTISHASMTCNPIKNGTTEPFFLYTLHYFYAMLLFKEAVAEVLR